MIYAPYIMQPFTCTIMGRIHMVPYLKYVHTIYVEYINIDLYTLFIMILILRSKNVCMGSMAIRIPEETSHSIVLKLSSSPLQPQPSPKPRVFDLSSYIHTPFLHYSIRKWVARLETRPTNSNFRLVLIQSNSLISWMCRSGSLCCPADCS